MALLEMRSRHRQLRPRRVVVGGNYKCLLLAGSEKGVVVGASLQMANRKEQDSLGGGNIVSIHKKYGGRRMVQQ